MAPASEVVSEVPEVSLSGATVAVPALKWSVAVGFVVPIPTLPEVPMVIEGEDRSAEGENCNLPALLLFTPIDQSC